MLFNTIELSKILEEAKDSVTSVSVSGHEILTSSLDCYSRVYDIRNGKLTSNCIGGVLLPEYSNSCRIRFRRWICLLLGHYIGKNYTGLFEHKGSRIVHSLSPHPSETKLLTASLGQIWFWGQNSKREQRWK
ncbi:WD repeat domain-containing protein 83 [Armadillidium vulgare]|nr:WD repeat domain-containing protein 83 [Armadillidium vulgare]